MIKDTVHTVASDGKPISVHRWLPDSEPQAAIFIAHGMMEFAMRYDRFAERAVAKKWIVLAPDLRGHGETAGTLESLGHLDESGGFERSVADIHEIVLEFSKNQPGIPLFLLGHSYGSFLSQMFIERYGSMLSACALSGTRGPDPLEVTGGKLLTALMCAAGARSKRSPLLFNMSFAPCNARIPGAKSPNAWLTRDETEVERYDASPWCGFMPTVGFWSNLMNGLSVIHRPTEIASIPKDLPIFLFAGSEDPIGKYGKTIDRLEQRYRQAGITQVDRVTYPGGRHEMFQEIESDKVMTDVFDWFEKHGTASQ